MALKPEALIAESQILVIRRATPADADVCGRICFQAFGTLAEKHNFPPDFPAPEIPIHVLSTMFSHPSFFCVVAEQDGKIVGSNCLDERTPIAGVGPITIDPSVQNRSVGRQLMQAVMSRAAERKFAGVRLVQAAYHNRSLSLYSKLGFVVKPHRHQRHRLNNSKPALKAPAEKSGVSCRYENSRTLELWG